MDIIAQCTVCSDNHVLLNGKCVEKVPRCETVSPSDPGVCIKCVGSYIGDSCNDCGPSSSENSYDIKDQNENCLSDKCCIRDTVSIPDTTTRLPADSSPDSVTTSTSDTSSTPTPS